MLIVSVIIVCILVSVSIGIATFLWNTAEKSCNYTGEFGEWGECDQDGMTTRTRPYEGEEMAHCTYKEEKKCDEIECQYGEEYGEFGEPDQNGVMVATRSLVSGAINVCKDLVKTKKANVLEIDVKEVVGNPNVELKIMMPGATEWKVINPEKQLVVGKNKIFIEEKVNTINIYYSDGGDIFVNGITYNGTSIAALGTTERAKGLNLFWKHNYQYKPLDNLNH